MKLVFCNNLNGEPASLKNIDPLDYKGDGSNLLLETGDRAIVADASASGAAFYTLKEAAGQSDNGILLLIPNNNPGDFYWSCCGFTKDVLSAPSGTKYIIEDGSRISPSGFTGNTASYLTVPFVGWDKGTDGTDRSYSGTAIRDNKLYVISGSDLHVWDITDNSYQTVGITNSHGFNNTPGHCIYSPEGNSDNILSDIESQTEFSRFFIDEEITSHLSFSFISPATDWGDIFGSSQTPEIAVRFGKWHYCAPSSTSLTGFGRIDVTNGEVHKLADFPAAPDSGCFIPDFETGKLYFLNGSSIGELFRYSPDSDTWETLASNPTNIWSGYIGWIDPKTNQLIIPGYSNDIHIYDIITDTWSSGSYDTSEFWGSYPLFYEEIGGIWPFGLNRSDTFSHVLIKKDNPFAITKS